MRPFLPIILSFCFALSAAAQVTPRFKVEEIDTQLGIGYGLALADVNGDGKTDILLADKDVIAWYESPTWTKHIIAEKLTEKDHVCIAARDIDGDGKCEIAVGAQWNPGDTENSGAVFYLQAPEDRTKLWKPVELSHEPTVHRMRWVRNRSGRYDLIVAPLHGRGNKNGEGAGAKILAYHKPQDVTLPWNTSVVFDEMHMTHNFEVVPAGGPAEAESLVLAGREGIVRLTPNEKGWSQQWIAHHPKDAKDLKGAGEVRVGAFAGGQPYVATVEPMHGTQLVLYTPPPNGPKNVEWIRTVLDDTLTDAHALACYDFLGLNNRQIAVGWRSMQKVGAKVGIKLFWTTKEDGSGWQQMLLDDNTMACEDLMAADLDGDRDVDIVACGRRTKNLKIYWNLRNN